MISNRIRFLENKVPPPIVALMICVAMGIIGWSNPATYPGGSVHGIVSITIAAIGIVFGGPAFIAFRRANTTINPVDIERASTLVTTGIYRVTRNPMYVGLAAVISGWAYFLANTWYLAGPLIFILYTTRFQIIPEERVMKAKFGQTYEAYRKRVRRWI